MTVAVEVEEGELEEVCMWSVVLFFFWWLDCWVGLLGRFARHCTSFSEERV